MQISFRPGKGWRVYLGGRFNGEILRTARKNTEASGFDQLGYFQDGARQPNNILWFNLPEDLLPPLEVGPQLTYKDQHHPGLLEIAAILRKYNPETPLRQRIKEGLSGPEGQDLLTDMIDHLKDAGKWPEQPALDAQVQDALANPEMAPSVAAMLLDQLRKAERLPLQPSLEEQIKVALTTPDGDSVALDILRQLAGTGNLKELLVLADLATESVSLIRQPDNSYKPTNVLMVN